jgi:hypothetical protein
LKRHAVIGWLLIESMRVVAQEPTGLPGVYEQQLENQAEREDRITEDDTQWQQWQYLQNHPLNLNTADEDELKELHLLTDLQISNFLRYRKMLAALVNVYELQAIPTWDIVTIRCLLPFITVQDEKSAFDKISKRFKQGEQKLLLRLSTVPERSKGYIKSGGGSTYSGSPVAVLFRYTYKYKNLLQYGITGDKDAGEQLGKGTQQTGFDFYSFHFFVRKVGVIHSLAMGDFTVHLGQGLIQWQGMAFKKSAAVINVKRQAPVLQPYSSAGEFNFYRGMGITLQQKQWALTVFGSMRKLSANLVSDSVTNSPEYISSLLTSGYHRSLAELADKNRVQCITTGGSLQFRNTKAHVGINAVQHRFSKPFKTAKEPYDLFALNGNTFSNYSVDYGYTVRNMHLFGEVAVDKYLHIAQLHGMLVSLDPKIDMSLLYRSISSRYQSLFSNAFTENSVPVNEKGCYAGITVRPGHGVQIDAYADVFAFPWLRFQTNAPATGHEYLLQLTCTPNKQVELYTRFRQETKPMQAADSARIIRPLENVPRRNWRTQLTYKYNHQITLRSRVEAVWYGNKEQSSNETGFLFFQDIHVKPAFTSWSFNGRIQYMETGGYNSRIYAMENTMLSNYSIPAFFDKGLRYSIVVNYRLMQRLMDRKTHCMLTLGFAQTVYPSKRTIGSGDDAIEGQKRSEIKLQVIVYRR